MLNMDLDTEPGLGTPPLRSFYGFALGCALQAHNALWIDGVGSEPTSPQFAVLEILAAWPGSDQRYVGDLAFLDKSSTMDIVRRLTRNQWITRQRSTADTRRDVLELTSAAGIALEQLKGSVGSVQEHLLEPLEEEAHERFLHELAVVGRADLDRVRECTSQLPGVLLRRARQVHTALLADELGPGITGSQLATIITLARDPGINQRVLGEASGLDKSTAADVVSRLDRRGWILRRRDPADGRRQVLELTDVGAEAVRDLAPRVLEVQKTALGVLSPEQATRFLEDLSKVARLAPEA